MTLTLRKQVSPFFSFPAAIFQSAAALIDATKATIRKDQSTTLQDQLLRPTAMETGKEDPNSDWWDAGHFPTPRNGNFPTPRFGHFPTPKNGHFSTQLRKIKHIKDGILTAAKILRNVAEKKGCWLFWDSYTHLGAHTFSYIYMLSIF